MDEMKQFNKSHQESHSAFLEDRDVQKFIKFRKIDEADFGLLERLSEFPSSLFFEFHNFFNGNKDSSLPELEGLIGSYDEGERKEFAKVLAQFAGSYHWTTCYNLIRLFENRKQK